MSQPLQISVVYALAERQVVFDMEIPAGTTARDAAQLSRMPDFFSELDTAAVALGVFGEHVSDDYVMRPGDRLEFYRELVMDPMQLRRQRASADQSAKTAKASSSKKNKS